jgi:hypothetical protein
MPNLVDLHLEECTISSKVELLQLVGVSGLTSRCAGGLQLKSVAWAKGSQEGQEEVVLPLTVVPALEQCGNLVKLQLHCYWKEYHYSKPFEAPAATYSCISRMQHLKDLAIVLPPEAPADFLPSVPTGLTHLQLESTTAFIWPERSPLAVLQQILQLQHLQSLQIKSVYKFDAATLVNMTQLLCLQLEGMDVDAAVLARMPHLQQLVLEDCRSAAPAASALEGIGQLSQLRVLKLLHWTTAQNDGSHMQQSLLHEAPVGRLSALIASSHLQRLHISCVDRHNSFRSPLPEGFVAHMFPQGRLLAQLVSLQLGPEHECTISHKTSCILGEDLQHIALSCPHLKSLHIKGVPKAGTAADALPQLCECRVRGWSCICPGQQCGCCCGADDTADLPQLVLQPRFQQCGPATLDLPHQPATNGDDARV